MRLIDSFRCYCGNSSLHISKRLLSNSPKFVDIVISGGGMVGLSLACGIGNSSCFTNKKVLLLENSVPYKYKDWRKIPYENRVSTITPGSKRFLEDINVWDGISKRRFNAFDCIQVWESLGPGSISFNSSDVGSKDLAYIIENSVIVESCAEKIEKLKNVNTKFQTSLSKIVQKIQKNEDHIIIETSTGERIKTKLLIGADGFNSFVRKFSGIETYDQDYNQSAVVATLKVNPLGDTTAFQRYLTTGPIAMLPLSNEHYSLVWSTGKLQAKALMKMTEEEFCLSINETLSADKKINSLLSNILKASSSILQPGKFAGNSLQSLPHVVSVQSGSRGMFPLGLMHANYYVKSRIALVGDAAHRIHPMAGQGVNLGFGDVRALVECLEKSIENGEDFGTLNQLLPYETERQRHVVSVIGVVNGLNNLYSTELFPVVAARNIGLSMTDALSGLKNQFIKYAMQ